MKVDYTVARKVDGLQGIWEWIWNVQNYGPDPSEISKSSKGRFVTSVSSSTSDLPSITGVAIGQLLEEGKLELVTFGATLDRGQAYNPTSSDYYKDRMDFARRRIDKSANHN
jgi:hypothetical protein